MVDPERLRLIDDHPGRFLVGSDKIDHLGGYGAEIRKYGLLIGTPAPGPLSRPDRAGDRGHEPQSTKHFQAGKRRRP